jgi:hypothetical protein
MANIVIPYKPQPRQRKYHQATDIDELLYGGAAGGGKSEATIWDALKYAITHPSSRQIIFRRTFPDLQRSIVMRTLQAYPQRLGKYNQSKHEWTFINGSIIELAYWDNDSNYANYQGAEYDVIRWEELTQFEERWYVYMLSRLRGSRPYPRSVKSTTNPGGVGHTWVKKRFLDIGAPEQVHDVHETDDNGNPLHDREGKPVISRRIFIPANIYDNEALLSNDPGYLTRLQMLPDNERKQLLDGDWDTFAGQYFSEFSRALHVVEPFEIPTEWRRYRAMDEGYNDPFVCLWFAIDFDGNCYLYREFVKSKLLSHEQAETVLRMTPKAEKIDYTVADTSFWNKGKADGKAPFEVFFEHGIPMTQATKERVNGWKRVREWLHPIDEVDPVSGNTTKGSKFKIFSNCRHAIESLPAMVFDDIHIEDIASHSLDHVPDAIRYFVMSRPSPSKVVKLEDTSIEARVRRNIANIGKSKRKGAQLI